MLCQVLLWNLTDHDGGSLLQGSGATSPEESPQLPAGIILEVYSSNRKCLQHPKIIHLQSEFIY